MATVIEREVCSVYINLMQRPDRRQSIEERLQRAGMKAGRFEALTAASARASSVTHEWNTTLNSRFDSAMPPNQIVAMTAGERGCAASHVELWKRCAALSDDAPPLLVLEDDLVFSDSFGAHMAALIAVVERAVPRPAERALLLYPAAFVGPYWRDAQPGLAHRAIRLRTGVAVPGGGVVELREACYCWQTCCYALWPAAARRLLEVLPVDAPVDNFLSKHILHGRVRALVCEPMLAMQEAPYEGDIERSGFPAGRAAPEDRLRNARRDGEVKDYHTYIGGAVRADESLFK